MTCHALGKSSQAGNSEMKCGYWNVRMDRLIHKSFYRTFTSQVPESLLNKRWKMIETATQPEKDSWWKSIFQNISFSASWEVHVLSNLIADYKPPALPLHYHLSNQLFHHWHWPWPVWTSSEAVNFWNTQCCSKVVSHAVVWKYFPLFTWCKDSGIWPQNCLSHQRLKYGVNS